MIDTMKRYEVKYLLSPEQTKAFEEGLKGHMELDRYGLTTILSLYYDTPDCRLIRTSIDKPLFKEKLRLRSYGLAKADSPLYLEIKRKACGLVYKRRVGSTQEGIDRFFEKRANLGEGQIAKELISFRDQYETLRPNCLIAYDRKAFFEKEGDLRLTIDRNPRYRFDELNLSNDRGTPLLGEGETILEIKVQEAMPLWLTHLLDELKIYPASFSKYGEAYKREIALLERKEKPCLHPSSLPATRRLATL